MLKYILSFLIIFTLSTSSVLAAGFVLNNIGALSTGGYQYGEWWYQGENPALSGTTSPSATVEVNIDGTSQTVTADSAGLWTAATTMPAGDHTVTLTSEGSVITFTLHINQEIPADIGAPAESTQPVAGITTPTLILIFGGLSLTILGIYAKRHARL